jgi:predicted lysophospholipase L1 biosynthesis ABC-type transport system permease subunit
MRSVREAGVLLIPAAVAMACCAGLPALAGIFTGATLAAILGGGVGVFALTAGLVGVVMVLRVRRSRVCPPSKRRFGG